MAGEKGSETCAQHGFCTAAEVFFYFLCVCFSASDVDSRGARYRGSNPPVPKRILTALERMRNGSSGLYYWYFTSSASNLDVFGVTAAVDWRDIASWYMQSVVVLQHGGLYRAIETSSGTPTGPSLAFLPTVDPPDYDVP